MSADAAFAHARTQLEKNGGVATVILGRDQDVPSAWSAHPRVHWTVASEVNRHQLGHALPSNTRLVLFTERIDAPIFRAIRKETDRRHLPYLSRKTAQSVCEELEAHWFPARVPRHGPLDAERPSVSAAPPPAASAPALEAAEPEAPAADALDLAADAAPTTTTRGKGVMAFIQKHGNLSPVVSNADEA